ncbi:serine/threonine-protein phosphatase 7 long form-like protein [Gossypium australe]|uniref:Serine/threonine-protein phosphatase 7 long form-like protein n=1 Tax=Gossypium australe TaxID=47621 RepID=A0A5B6VYS9_9ROSI|nr:serine/threonine-protein phosphatase 7 long form-like protein [Gossypium australe]
MDIIYAARAFILQLISGILILDVNQTKISIMYLPLLEDLELAGRFSWGSAVLACLYCELCRASKPSTKTMGGCCLLLQSWALYRMPFLASVSHQPYMDNCTGNQAIVHRTYVPYDDRDSFRGWHKIRFRIFLF